MRKQSKSMHIQQCTRRNWLLDQIFDFASKWNVVYLNVKQCDGRKFANILDVL